MAKTESPRSSVRTEKLVTGNEQRGSFVKLRNKGKEKINPRPKDHAYNASEFIELHDMAFRYYGRRTEEIVYDQDNKVFKMRFAKLCA